MIIWNKLQTHGTLHRTTGAARFHQFLTITSFYAEHEGCKEKSEKLPQETHFLDGKTSSETQINVDKSTGYSRREGDDYTMEKIKDIFLNIKDAI